MAFIKKLWYYPYSIPEILFMFHGNNTFPLVCKIIIVGIVNHSLRIVIIH